MKLEVKQIRGFGGKPEAQRVILRGLGLHGVGTSVVVDNTPSFRGMIRKVLHLVDVKEISA
jgi:large subunit ribosomal protein L30